jgi:anti-anti-sigma factor
MEITRTVTGDVVDIVVEGRLDGYWADHLNAALTEAVREGHHHLRLDCTKVSFLSSASIGVLMKFYKELGRINGTFHVVNPSPPVSAVLRMMRLTALLVEPARPEAGAAAPERQARRLERDSVGLDIFELDARATMSCRIIGSAVPLTTGTFADEHCVSLESLAPTFAIGVGAFGDSFADCRARFGELLSVAGATAYQPGDGTNVADYLLATGALAADVRMLYGLACEGPFSHLIRFETLQRGATIGLAQLLARCLDEAAADTIGVVIVAEVAGLVGAALRRSPAERFEDADFFTHPGVRTRLTFTAEPTFTSSVALAAGIVTRRASGYDGQLRPMGGECLGHMHAAAFRFRPIEKGRIDFRATVSGLFDAEQLLGVLHLLNDDRPSAGAGESQFVRGACWVGRLNGFGEPGTPSLATKTASSGEVAPTIGKTPPRTQADEFGG